jgi:hypothetical protein
MKTKAALEAVEFAKQMQSGKMPITDENIDKLCKLAGVKLYRNVDVTRRNGRMIPTRTRRMKEGSTYFSANMAAKLVGWSRDLLVRHVSRHVPEMTPEHGVIVRKRRRRKTLWISRALLKQLFPDSIKG